MMTTLYDMHELEQLCERQRSALDAMLEAVGKLDKYYKKFGLSPRFYDLLDDLFEIYRQVSSLSTQTGSSEK